MREKGHPVRRGDKDINTSAESSLGLNITEQAEEQSERKADMSMDRSMKAEIVEVEKEDELNTRQDSRFAGVSDKDLEYVLDNFHANEDQNLPEATRRQMNFVRNQFEGKPRSRPSVCLFIW